MNEVSFPAVVLMARPDRETRQAVGFVDNKALWSLAEVEARLAVYRRLEELGGWPYELEVASLGEADRALAEFRAWIEYEHGWRESPDLEPEPEQPDYLAQAYELARAAFDGDLETLARLERAQELVKQGMVTDLGGGEWEVKSRGNGGLVHTYRVNGRCGCSDSVYRERVYCKHKLAVCLVRKMRELESGAGGAENTPAPGSEVKHAANVRIPEQPQHTTDLDLSQAGSVGVYWDFLTITYRDGRRENRTDLDREAVEAQLKAAGWSEPLGNRWYMNPAARA